MKKSVIFAIAVIYIISIVVVGLFGASIRGAPPTIYCDAIQIVDPTNSILTETKVNGADYGFTIDYQENLSFSIQAKVKPTNCSFPAVDYFYNTDQNEYIIEQEDNNVATIKLTDEAEQGCWIEGYAQSTDGKKLTVKFVIYAI